MLAEVLEITDDNMRRYLVFILLGVALGFITSSQLQSVYADVSLCQDAQARDLTGSGDQVSYSAPTGSNISKVCIKSGQNFFIFINDGSDGCYTVNGVNTNSINVQRTGTPGPSCQEISHVDAYYAIAEAALTSTPVPTSVPTISLTDTPVPTTLPVLSTNSPSPTLTITPTPTDAPTPTATPTPTTTPTPTYVPSPTPTPVYQYIIVYQQMAAPTPTPIQYVVSQQNSTTPSPTLITQANTDPLATIKQSPKETVSIGQVLGTSTKKLPETGAETYLLISLLSLMFGGMGSIVFGVKWSYETKRSGQ